MKKNKITQFDYGYLAGIIEGEGCFSMQKDKNSNSIDACVQVNINDLQLVKWLQKKFKGKVYKTKHQCFNWIAYRIDILEHLKKIVDNLLFKKQQCISFIALCELLKPNHSGIPYTESEAQRRDDIYNLHKYIIQNNKIKAGY